MDTFEILHQADCDMEVVCIKKWDQLIKTDKVGIKFCVDCKKLVFFTETVAELRIAAERGLCVYIKPDSAARSERDLKQYHFPEITHERLRRIEAKALRRLMGPTLGVAIIR